MKIKKDFKILILILNLSYFNLAILNPPHRVLEYKFRIQGSDNILKEITRDLKSEEDNPYKGIKLNTNQIKKLSPI